MVDDATGLRVIVFQNHEVEDAAMVGEVFSEMGATLSVVDCFNGAPPPSPGSGNVLVVLGGPMNVYEEATYPFLAWETRWIKEWVAANHPAIGICLGAQLIAKAFGSRVVRSPKPEIGHDTVTLTPAGAADPVFSHFPTEVPVVQWHEDAFMLPPGAVHLARSSKCEYQAFRLRHTIGLQFHLEVGTAKMREWLREYDRTGDTKFVSMLDDYIAREGVYADLCRLFVRNFCRHECGISLP